MDSCGGCWVGSERRHSRNNIRLLDDSADLVEDGLAHGHLLPDHGVVLVVGVIRVPELAAAGELELHELMPELTLVAHTDREKRADNDTGRIAAHSRVHRNGGRGSRVLRGVLFLRFRDSGSSRCPDEAVRNELRKKLEPRRKGSAKKEMESETAGVPHQSASSQLSLIIFGG